MENAKKISIEYVTIDKLVPYDKNPRNNDPAIDKVAASIRAFGFKVPMVIDENNSIVCGHSRYRAVKKLIKDGQLPDDLASGVPCIRATDLTPEQIRAFRVADNKVAELAEWNEDLLKEEILDLPEFNFEEFGFDMDAFTDKTEKPANTEEDDFDEESAIKVKPRGKVGDIFQLGDHRLMIGDSTSPDDVRRLMGEDLADLVVTDPPYNVAYEGNDGMTIKNDNMEDSQFRDFLKRAFKTMTDAMKPGATFYIWHADSEGYNFRGACHDVGLQVRQCLIWKKNALVLGRQDYQWIHEPCLYGWKDGAGHSWYSDRSQTTVLEYDKPKKNDVHPTMKPIALFSYQIGNSSKSGDIVLDLFGGSGTTIMCCERMGRKARLMELDPRYAEAIMLRWEGESGQKAVLLTSDGTPENAPEKAPEK